MSVADEPEDGAPVQPPEPLAAAELATAGDSRRSQLIVKESDNRYHLATGQWRSALVDPEELQEVARQLRRGGWCVRLVPDLAHIEVDPERLSGNLTIRGRRIAAEDVAEIAKAENGEAILRQDYGLSAAEIHDAQRWWVEVQRLERAA